MPQFETIEQTFVNQYSDNVLHLSQQKNSRLLGLFNVESFIGESKFFHRLGETEVYEKTGRFSTTKLVPYDYSRRQVTFRPYRWATLVDDFDKLRIMHSPESDLSMSARMAFGRKQGEICIGALLGRSYAGKDGKVAVDLPDTQKYACRDDSNALSSLNVEALIDIKERFAANEAVDQGETIHIACTASDISSMLREDKISSADYNSVRALVNGEVNTFMGFMFHRLELLPKLATAGSFDTDGAVGSGSGVLSVGTKRLVAFVPNGAKICISNNVMARVEPRADRDYANQVYMRMEMGGTRLEEEKVMEILAAA